MIESFLANVGRAIDKRVDERLARQGSGDDRTSVGVAIGSLALGIPLSGVAGGTAGAAGIVVVWIAIVLVNFAYALGRPKL